ncbi:MAG: archaellin/type IV pilin N-terminal domain-containing protein [Candidatus Promineifilaceae bacterium]
MFRFINKFHQDERGLTALETAIILIAFIVVASVFAFTILSAGTFSTERGKEAVYAGLGEVQASMEVKGTVIATATTTGSSGTVDELVFTVGNVVGGEPIDMDKVLANYRDEVQYAPNITMTVVFVGDNDSDMLLERGELAQITVDLAPLTTPLSVNKEFAIELQPPKGSTVSVQRVTPAYIDPVMSLD